MESVIVLDSSDEEQPTEKPEYRKRPKCVEKLPEITCIPSNKHHTLSPRNHFESEKKSNSVTCSMQKIKPKNKKVESTHHCPQVPHSLPIIVSTESLADGSIKTPHLSEITIKRCVSNTTHQQHINVDQVPSITITKKQKTVDTKEFFKMAKSEPVIHILDDDNETINTNETILFNVKDQKPVEIINLDSENTSTIENSTKQQSDDIQFFCTETLIDNSNSLLSIDSNSEKENSEPFTLDCEEPALKKPKGSFDCGNMPIYLSKTKNNELSSKTYQEDSSVLNNNESNSFVNLYIETDDDIHIQFKKFLLLYLEIDKSNPDRENTVKKIIRHYKAVNIKYSHSNEFHSSVINSMNKMKESSGYGLLYIHEIVEDLKSHRLISKQEKTNSLSAANKNNDSAAKTQLRIKKLEKYMNSLIKKIKKLDEAEVTSDNEESAYILADKYKARLIDIYDKVCKLKGERGVKKQRNINRILSGAGLDDTQLPNITDIIKKSIKNPKNWFPDFHEILKCVRQCIEEAKFSYPEEIIRDRARYIFTKIGTTIQKDRQNNDYVNLCWISEDAPDPADNNKDLAEALNRNRPLATKKMDEIFDKYADIEFASKLIAEEVPDDDVSQSETSDEDIIPGEKSNQQKIKFKNNEAKHDS